MITTCKTRNECIDAINENGGIGLFEAGAWLACHAGEAEEYRSTEYLDTLEQYDWVEPVNTDELQQNLF